MKVAKNHKSTRNDEQGIALLLTVFVVTIASILVTSLAYRSQFDLRSSRSFAETIQADYVLKSCLSLAVSLIELPKEPGIGEDWLGDLWAQIGSAPELPMFGSNLQPRLSIVDDRGKINVNAILEQGGGTNQQQLASEWKTALAQIFAQKGGFQASTAKEEYQTLGGRFFDAEQQVAVIHDWLDSDSVSHQSPFFNFPGIEGTADKEWFYNRKLMTLDELLLVPGMTREKLAKVAPFIKIPPSNLPNDTGININTAPYDVLTATQIPENVASDIIQQRIDQSISQADLANIRLLAYGQAATSFFQNNMQVSSNHFSAYARVKTPNGTRWLHALISAGLPSPGGQRKAEVSAYSIR